MFMSLYPLLREQSSLQPHSIKVFPKAVTQSAKQKGRNNLIAYLALFTPLMVSFWDSSWLDIPFLSQERVNTHGYK